jgi:uncharacterized protein YdaU (DUF1376 family)
MHYYKRNIGDYHKKAGRLSIMQHGTYTLLIDACYDRERFPTLEEAIDWCWASSPDEIAAVQFVLSKFFTLEDDGRYTQARIMEEIAIYHGKCKTNQCIALEREAAKRGSKDNESSTNRAPVVNERAPNQEPRTTNQETDIKPLVPEASGTNVPHLEIINLYNTILGDKGLTRVRPKLWTGKRASALKSRWREDKDRQNLTWWTGYFEYVAKSQFLMGEAKTDNPWKADLEWLITQNNMIKVCEGKYHA